MSEEKHVARTNIFFAIMEYRNKNDEQACYPKVYDCGELGLCRVYWRQGWECEWLVVEKLPFTYKPSTTETSIVDDAFDDKWIEEKKKLEPITDWTKNK